MNGLQLIGLSLWRGGLLVAAGWLLYESARLVLRWIDVPAEVEAGLGLALAGFALVMVSLIAERIVDLRAEHDTAG